PPYTGYPAFEPQAGTGTVGLAVEAKEGGEKRPVRGTVVTIRAAVDQPLRAACLEFEPKGGAREPAGLLWPREGGVPPAGFSVTGRPQAVQGHTARRRLPVRIEPGNVLTARFRPAQAGSYVLRFENEEEITGDSGRFEVRLVEDPT